MARTASTMLELGTEAPPFHLPDPDGRIWSLDEFAEAPALVVAFICNHCPFVKHIRAGLADFARDYSKRGVGMVAISANDVDAYPQDGPDYMAEEARDAGYVFPYLYDETQEVAKSYRAACTPDFYVFDEARRLVYRGQFDASRPGNGVPVDGADLRAAVDAVLEGRTVPSRQQPSIGCNIKWRADNAPDYAA